MISLYNQQKMINFLKNTSNDELVKSIDKVLQSQESQLSEADKLSLLEVKVKLNASSPSFSPIKALELLMNILKFGNYLNQDDWLD